MSFSPEVTSSNFNSLIDSVNSTDRTSFLKLSSTGALTKTNLLSFVWEKLCGLCGGKDMCNDKLVGLTIINYLDHAISHPEIIEGKEEIFKKIGMVQKLPKTGNIR